MSALEHRDFRVFFIGAIVSNSGTWLQIVALGFVMKVITDSATWVGAAAFAQTFPIVLVGTWGGVLADRIARRQILLVTLAAQLGCAVAYAAMWAGGVRTPVPYVAVGLVNGIVNGFHFPAWQAFVSELVPRELLLNAVTLNSAQFNASRAFGPALGGIVLAVGGPAWSFAINAVTFTASLFAVAMISVRPAARAPVAGARPSALADIRAALGYVRRSPGIRRVLVVAGLTSALGQPLIYLVVVFADDVFRVGEVRYGVLTAAMGIGAVLATPFVAGWGSGMRRSTLVGVGATAYGASVMGFGIAPGYWLGVAFLAVVGASHLTSASTMNTVVQLQSAEHMRAKMLSFYLTILTLGLPVGTIVQGALSDAVGPRWTVAGAGVVLLVTSGWLASSGRLRVIDAADT